MFASIHSVVMKSLIVLGITAKNTAMHLISLCGNFVERHSFSIVSGKSPETMRKLCLPTKFPHQEISRLFKSLKCLKSLKFTVFKKLWEFAFAFPTNFWSFTMIRSYKGVYAHAVIIFCCWTFTTFLAREPFWQST